MVTITYKTRIIFPSCKQRNRANNLTIITDLIVHIREIIVQHFIRPQLRRFLSQTFYSANMRALSAQA